MRKYLILVCVFIELTEAFAQTTSYADQAEQFYNLYSDYVKWLDAKDVKKAEEVAVSIRRRFDGLGIRDKNGVTNWIVTDLVQLFETKENKVFLEKANRALFILPQDEPNRFDIMSTMAEVYLLQKNLDSFQTIITQMINLPGANNGEKAAIVQELQSKANKIIPFPDLLDGHWIANRYMTVKGKEGRPWLVLDIYDYNNTKQAYISEFSGVTSKALKQKHSPLRYSEGFDFDSSRESFVFSFYNSKTRQGNASLANTLYDTAQDTRAEFHAMAGDDRATIGQSFLLELIGALFGGINEGLAKKAATSKVSEDVVYISGYNKQNEVLKCNMKYQFQSASSNTMSTTTKNYIDQDFSFYRWNKEDSIVFGFPNCKPISPYVSKLNPGMELYTIKKQTSFWQFKYCGVTFLGVAIGAACTYFGISTIMENDWKFYQRKYNISESEARAMIKSDNPDKAMTYGVIATALGSLITISIPLVEHSVRTNKRSKAVENYNMSEFNRLCVINQ